MDEICEVVITGPSADWLIEFTRKLVSDRLAACGQNLTEVRSVFRWEGAVQDETEARVMLHTRQSLVPEIIEAARRDHPYDVPCVLAMPISTANPDYQQWVVAETHDPRLGRRRGPSPLMDAGPFVLALVGGRVRPACHSLMGPRHDAYVIVQCRAAYDR